MKGLRKRNVCPKVGAQELIRQSNPVSVHADSLTKERCAHRNCRESKARRGVFLKI